MFTKTEIKVTFEEAVLLATTVSLNLSDIMFTFYSWFHTLHDELMNKSIRPNRIVSLAKSFHLTKPQTASQTALKSSLMGNERKLLGGQF